MNIEKIRTEIEQLLTLIDGWSSAETMPEIEREVALSKLSRLYEQIKFYSSDEIIETIEDVAKAEENAVEQTAFDINTVSIDIQSEEDIETEAETTTETATEVEVQEEIIVEDVKTEPEIEVAPEVESEEEVAPEVEEPKEVAKPTTTDNVLFDIDIIPKQSRQRRSTLMSLYQSNEPAPLPETKKTEEPAHITKSEPVAPIVEQTAPAVETIPTSTKIATEEVTETKATQTIADVMASQSKRVADQLAEKQPISTYNERVRYNSFKDLDINERYLLSRELFGDDPQHCRQVLSNLESCTNYDDAMIYIAENFDWNEESAGAKVILTILENKFNI